MYFDQCSYICNVKYTKIICSQLRGIRRCTSNFQSKSSKSEQRIKQRRVVVTGIGVISPVGCNVKSAWENILKGYCGIKLLADEKYASLPCKIAAKIDEAEVKLHHNFSKAELRSLAPATVYALIAANEALEMAKWKPTNEIDFDRTGVAVGMGMVDLGCISETLEVLQSNGYNRVSPHFVPKILTNMAAGQISIKYGFRGPNHSVSTACATGIDIIFCL